MTTTLGGHSGLSKRAGALDLLSRASTVGLDVLLLVLLHNSAGRAAPSQEPPPPMRLATGWELQDAAKVSALSPDWVCTK